VEQITDQKELARRWREAYADPAYHLVAAADTPAARQTVRALGTQLAYAPRLTTDAVGRMGGGWAQLLDAGSGLVSRAMLIWLPDTPAVRLVLDDLFPEGRGQGKRLYVIAETDADLAYLGKLAAPLGRTDSLTFSRNTPDPSAN
jgi:hypothetical protein